MSIRLALPARLDVCMVMTLNALNVVCVCCVPIHRLLSSLQLRSSILCSHARTYIVTSLFLCSCVYFLWKRLRVGIYFGIPVIDVHLFLKYKFQTTTDCVQSNEHVTVHRVTPRRNARQSFEKLNAKLEWVLVLIETNFSIRPGPDKLIEGSLKSALMMTPCFGPDDDSWTCGGTCATW